jgi:hypothetical protein
MPQNIKKKKHTKKGEPQTLNSREAFAFAPGVPLRLTILAKKVEKALQFRRHRNPKP